MPHSNLLEFWNQICPPIQLQNAVQHGNHEGRTDFPSIEILVSLQMLCFSVYFSVKIYTFSNGSSYFWYIIQIVLGWTGINGSSQCNQLFPAIEVALSLYFHTCTGQLRSLRPFE